MVGMPQLTALPPTLTIPQADKFTPEEIEKHKAAFDLFVRRLMSYSKTLLRANTSTP